MTRPNLLVICGRNKRRSRTAEHIFKNDSRFHIRSAGLSPQSNRKISESDVNWADQILVMEADQKTKIRKVYQHLELPPIESLDIADDYEFMDDELVDTLKVKINSLLALNYEL